MGKAETMDEHIIFLAQKGLMMLNWGWSICDGLCFSLLSSEDSLQSTDWERKGLAVHDNALYKELESWSPSERLIWRSYECEFGLWSENCVEATWSTRRRYVWISSSMIKGQNEVQYTAHTTIMNSKDDDSKNENSNENGSMLSSITFCSYDHAICFS